MGAARDSAGGKRQFVVHEHRHWRREKRKGNHQKVEKEIECERTEIQVRYLLSNQSHARRTGSANQRRVFHWDTIVEGEVGTKSTHI